MIDRKCWTATICLGLMTLLGGHRLAAADPERMQPAELKAKMEAEGWTAISDSVFERQLGPNKVEHLGFGRGGLAWIIDELTRRLESLMIEQESYPSEDLAKAIDSLSVKIAGAKREMKMAPQGISSMTEAVVAGASCSDTCYSATADAYPLPSTQGAGAAAQATFNCACGYSGQTYAYAYARATQGTTMTVHSQENPRTGYDITSSASASVNGELDCYSEAYGSVWSDDLGIHHSVSDIHDSCPPPALEVAMSGPSSADFTTATCSTETWSATVSGGTVPYSYEWYVNGTQVGTGTSYSRSVCHNDADFTIQVTAIDSSSPVQSQSDSRAFDVTYVPPPLEVTMSGPSSVDFTSATCSTHTWSASASGGTTPYSYNWYYNGTQVGTGTSYSRSVCYNHADFTIQVTVTDSSSPVQSKSVSRAVDVTYVLNATMSGPSSTEFTTATCSTYTWSASVSGGTTPYTYNWYYNGTQVGTGTSYARSVCYNHADFTIQATVADSSSPVQSKSVSRAVDVIYNPPFTATISGSSHEYFATFGACRNVTWTSTVSGGTSPYSYQWKIGTTVVGTGSSYTRSVCRGDQPGFTLSLTVTGSNSAIATDTHAVTVEVEEYTNCGGPGQPACN